MSTNRQVLTGEERSVPPALRLMMTSGGDSDKRELRDLYSRVSHFFEMAAHAPEAKPIEEGPDDDLGPRPNPPEHDDDAYERGDDDDDGEEAMPVAPEIEMRLILGALEAPQGDEGVEEESAPGLQEVTSRRLRPPKALLGAALTESQATRSRQRAATGPLLISPEAADARWERNMQREAQAFLDMAGFLASSPKRPREEGRGSRGSKVSPTHPSSTKGEAAADAVSVSSSSSSGVQIDDFDALDSSSDDADSGIEELHNQRLGPPPKSHRPLPKRGGNRGKGGRKHPGIHEL